MKFQKENQCSIKKWWDKHGGVERRIFLELERHNLSCAYVNLGKLIFLCLTFPLQKMGLINTFLAGILAHIRNSLNGSCCVFILVSVQRICYLSLVFSFFPSFIFPALLRYDWQISLKCTMWQVFICIYYEIVTMVRLVNVFLSL